jgi:FtsP/CotA-like multicopper oxidase with cupredoxin domain
MNRRTFLRLSSMIAVTGSAGALLAGCASKTPALNAGQAARVTPGNASTPDFKPDLDLTLKATQASLQLLPGAMTNVYTYVGSVNGGDPASVQAIPNSYLGPIIRAKTGQRVRVTLQNDLPGNQATIVHWHGLHLPEDMDGHPRFKADPGGSYVYEFEVKDRAGTYWFHPHTHTLTAEQVYQGLAGLFIVSDEKEAALGLPDGEFDVPLVLQDRTFDAQNQWNYTAAGGMGSMSGMGGMGSMGNTSGMSATNGMGSMSGMNGMGAMMESVMGFLGQRILVNGAPDFTLPVAARAYRMRLLNGSNSRIFKLAWSDSKPMTVIGTDGGLLESPVERAFVMLAPGERIELFADFSDYNAGDTFTLNSLPFEGAEGVGQQGMDMGIDAPPLGAPMTLMKVRIERVGSTSPKLPATLVKLNSYRIDDAVNAKSPRLIRLQQRNMRWLLNGRSFEMDAVADDEVVKLNTTEVWELVNETNPGEMMDPLGMAHPMHIHGVRFLVIERIAPTVPELLPGWESVRAGYVNDGWKDTVLVMPGERVKVLTRFTDYTGKFVFHCHNLEHEDMGMMRNYEVRA